MEFIFQIYIVWFSCLLVSKLEILNLFISMGNLQFQIWVSDQSKNGFVYFYWLFAALPCVISDILIECIGFLENFTKLSEKSYGTTYFINKIEKTFSYWLQNFADNLTRPGTKKVHARLQTVDGGGGGRAQLSLLPWHGWAEACSLSGGGRVSPIGDAGIHHMRNKMRPEDLLCWRLNVSHPFCGRKF